MYSRVKILVRRFECLILNLTLVPRLCIKRVHVCANSKKESTHKHIKRVHVCATSKKKALINTSINLVTQQLRGKAKARKKNRIT